MGRAPFDTTRLDEECERVAHELSGPEMAWGRWSGEVVNANPTEAIKRLPIPRFEDVHRGAAVEALECATVEPPCLHRSLREAEFRPVCEQCEAERSQG
jgi:hypothetical protein